MNELAKAIAELIQTLNGGASGIGQAFKTHAPDLWRVAVYQARLDASIDLAAWELVGVAFLVLGWLMVRHARNLQLASVAARTRLEVARTTRGDVTAAREAYEKADKYYRDNDGYWVSGGLSILVGFVFVCAGLACNLAAIINPEYAAASELAARFLRK